VQQGTNLPRVGNYNRAVVLGAIQVSDGISRVQIAARTGLTAQAVSVIVRRLLDEGLVREDGSAPSTGGKPRTILRVDPAAGYAVGVHFDPGRVRGVLADLAGRPVASASRTLGPAPGPDAVIRAMAATVRRVVAGVPGDRVLGVGLAAPGPIDQREGVLMSPPRLGGWSRVPVKRMLEEATGLPVTVDNDATAAAIGERWAGLGRSATSFAYLYMGTGVGGGLFLDGQIYRGRTLNAAEFGHITVVPGGAPCHCGNLGCVEAVCRPGAIVDAVRARLAAGAQSRLAASWARDPDSVGHPAICAAAVAGDPVAREVIDTVAGHLARAAVIIVNILDVDLLILGGPALRGVGGIYREAVAREIASRAMTRLLHTVGVEVSPIAADAAAIGAASLVFHAAYAPRITTLLREGSTAP
jgi:predicted NBD/HSP70 family sugar kinase